MATTDKDRARRYASGPDDIIWLDETRSCLKCKHKTRGENTCAAFPRRIPKEILSGGECEGANGVRFEEDEEESRQ